METKTLLLIIGLVMSLPILHTITLGIVEEIYVYSFNKKMKKAEGDLRLLARKVGNKTALESFESKKYYAFESSELLYLEKRIGYSNFVMKFIDTINFFKKYGNAMLIYMMLVTIYFAILLGLYS